MSTTRRTQTKTASTWLTHFWSNWLEWTVLIIYTIHNPAASFACLRSSTKTMQTSNSNHLQLLILSYQWTILWSTFFCSQAGSLCLCIFRAHWANLVFPWVPEFWRGLQDLHCAYIYISDIFLHAWPSVYCLKTRLKDFCSIRQKLPLGAQALAENVELLVADYAV